MKPTDEKSSVDQQAKNAEAEKYIAELISRARAAQKQIEFASQEEVDFITAKVAWACVEPTFAKKVADFCAEDSGMGHAPDKFLKIQNKVKGVFRDMKGRLSVGVVEVNKDKGIMKIAKPMGVVGAVIPVTNSEATPMCKALFALKTRNAIVMAPHPRTVKTNGMVIDNIRAVLKKHGWPEDLVINVETVSLEATKALMKQADITLATGGEAMVKAAYSSGKPCHGVGAGNAVIVVDESADLKTSATLVMRSKTFDNATSCSSENSLVIQEGVYAEMLKELQAVGGYLVSAEEKVKLQAAMWTDKGLSPNIVGQSAAKIATHAGIKLPEGKKFFMIEETGIGKGFPFSGEKLSVTMTIYKYKEFKDAVGLVNDITTYSGYGHSAGIHTTIENRVKELALRVRVSRLMVRQPQALANSGGWTNGMPMTLTLGCGSWGGNSTSSNVNWEHLLNYTWVSFPIPNSQPTDEELFGAAMRD
ncbi:MAG: aldehyde dehydrogenase family protein [Fibrobacteres bacterium]|nr:aldehyde dehydrogenase family protein [Fibrobacterota bacterium]